jgi:hypothetical protein
VRAGIAHVTGTLERKMTEEIAPAVFGQMGRVGSIAAQQGSDAIEGVAGLAGIVAGTLGEFRESSVSILAEGATALKEAIVGKDTPPPSPKSSKKASKDAKAKPEAKGK